MKLSLKLFAAFFFTGLTILAVFVIMQVLAARNFEAYLRQVEIERSSRLLDALPALFDEATRWQPLRGDPRRWRELLHQNGYDIPAVPSRRAEPPPRDQRDPRDRPRQEPPPRPNDDRNRPGSRPPPQRQDHDRPPRPPEPGSEDGRGRDPRPPEDPLGLGPRLCVLDRAKGFVVGDRTAPEELDLRAILVADRTVGWLGLRPRSISDTPLEATYLQRQLRLVLVVGSCLLLVTGVVALLLSRQVVRPVKAISQATRSLTQRQLETRIELDSDDEFGQLATDFNEMAATMQAFEQERRRWISDIAHELRTPLAILRGEIEAVQDGVRELRPATIESLHVEVVRLAKLVEDLHQLAVADTGAQVMRMSAIDLIDVVRTTAQPWQTRLGSHGIRLQLDLPATAEALVRGDSDRLQQVITNLLENSLRYAGAGAVVTLRTTLDKTQAVVEVQDSGPGVPAQSLPHLFERLYRVEKSRSRRLAGSGLGLAICKQIVTAHRGEIRAANADSGGLIVTIMLPMLMNEGEGEKHG